MKKLTFLYILKYCVFLMALTLTACDGDDDSGVGGLPPDYVDPDSVSDDDSTDETDSDTVVYNYITPQVDSDGRIIVAGRPPQYTDTATCHVISVAYDIANGELMDLEDYYADAIGKSGDELKEALTAIITDGFEAYSYGEARYIINIADRDPLYPSDSVYCFYEEMTGNYNWDKGATWNREHVWAKSHGLEEGEDVDNSTISAASDLHNLKAENPTVNSTKSNYDFAEKEDEPEYYGVVEDKFAFAPMVSARGDAARILMYMVLRWGDDNGLEFIDTADYSHTDDTYQGKLSDLIDWNSDDPVDPFEIRRNNVIYQYQNNRNPFVDHPELVDYVFGDKQDEVWDGGVVYNP